jgi:hypothetical protein
MCRALHTPVLGLRAAEECEARCAQVGSDATGRDDKWSTSASSCGGSMNRVRRMVLKTYKLVCIDRCQMGERSRSVVLFGASLFPMHRVCGGNEERSLHVARDHVTACVSRERFHSCGVQNKQNQKTFGTTSTPSSHERMHACTTHARTQPRMRARSALSQHQTTGGRMRLCAHGMALARTSVDVSRTL